MPFAGYEDWDDCIAKNRDKGNPEAYCGKIKHQVEDIIPPECIVKAYNHYKEKYPNLSERDLLDKSFEYLKNRDTSDFMQSFEIGTLLEVIAYQHDFLTYDAEADAESTHLQELFEQLKQYEQSYRTPEAQALRESLGGTLKPPVSSINVPFTLRNSETGAIVRGSVLENFDRNTKQLTPVSSSNVRGVGQFKDELLVQFHGSSKNPMRTYRYKMQSPEMADEAYRSLTNSSSPGRWVWENIRGHRAGETVSKSKLAPSLSPPNKGLPTIGGTHASLVEYSISNRVPVSRVANFEAMSEQLKRKTSNPSRNPNTGSRLEGTLEGRRQARDRGVNQLGVARQVRQLPKLDFVMIDLSEEELQERFKASQKKIQERKECQWITKNGVHICITPKESEKIEIPEKIKSRIRGGLGAKVGTYMRVAENLLKENKKISNEIIQELIEKYGFGTDDIKQFIENFDSYTESAKKIIAYQKEREEESKRFQEKLKNQPLRNAEDVGSENNLIENVSKYEIFRYVSRSELEILSKHDNKNEIFLVAGEPIVFTGDRYKVIVGADQVPKDCTIMHTHPIASRGKLKGLACPFSPTDYHAFLSTGAKRSIVFVQDGSGYMIEKTDNTKYISDDRFIKQDLRRYEKQAATEIVNENKSADCGIFRFNRIMCEKYNLKLKKFRWKE